MINGIDVSDAQGYTPAMAGRKFILIKATEGRSYVNPRQAAQAAAGRRTGAHVGFYHFLWPGSIAAQMEYFTQKCASLAGDSLWVDWEPTKGGLASCAEKDQALAELAKIRPDHRSGLYCDRERWLHVDTTSKRGDGLWIADPSHPAGHPLIKAPWLIHQYGSPGGVDIDVAQFADVAGMVSWAQRGRSSKPAPLPKPPPPPAHPTYTVHKGDTLTSIARTHGTTVAKLVKLNHITNPDHIVPGEVLKLR